MFKFIKQKSIALLNFIVSLATKCISLNDEPCLFRPALIDLNPPPKKKTSLLTIYD